MPTINGLKIRPAQTIGTGVTQMKTLAELGLKMPQHLDKMVTRMWTANYGPSFSNLIDKYAKVMNFESATEYTWKLMGSTYKNIPIIEVRDSNGTVVDNNYSGNVGAHGEMLQFVFPEKYFAKGETLLGAHNELYPFRIIGDGYAEGSNWVYTVTLLGNAYDNGCPKEDLYAGQRFSRTAAFVEEELSRRVGDVRKAIPTEMRNGWTTIRKDKKFTGAADIQQRLCCTIPVKFIDENNNVVTKDIDTWFTYEEFQFLNEWRKEKNDAELWSRDNRTNNGQYVDFGDSGNVIKIGNGIMAQMEPGQTVYYSEFDIEDFVDQLQLIFEQGNVPMNERHIVAVTGQRGMLEVNKSIKRISSGFSTSNNASNEIDLVALGLVSKGSSDVNSHALTYAQGQYTKYIGPNGIEIEFVCDASLDDPIRNKLVGLNGKGKLSSYAFYVFDMGSTSEPNIYRCKLTHPQYQDYLRYKIGMRNPWGLDNKFISSDEDASSMHTMTTLGACILDPSRCLRYLPAGL